jgi:hypothetical protein
MKKTPLKIYGILYKKGNVIFRTENIDNNGKLLFIGGAIMVFTVTIATILKIGLACGIIGYIGCANKKKIKKGIKALKSGIDNYKTEKE